LLVSMLPLLPSPHILRSSPADAATFFFLCSFGWMLHTGEATRKPATANHQTQPLGDGLHCQFQPCREQQRGLCPFRWWDLSSPVLLRNGVMQDAVWLYVEIKHMLLSCYSSLCDAGSWPVLAE
jgi:hypothetical protein